MRGFLLFCIGVTAWSSAVYASKPPKRTPQPGYECKIEDRGNFGLIQADLQVLESGELHDGYIKWDAGNGQFRNPWITAAFFRNANGSYSLEHGSIDIMQHIWDTKHGRHSRALELSLELTTNPILVFGTSRMVGRFEQSGGPFHLALDWSDTAALASGSSRLYLVARDTHRNMVDQVDIDRTVFSRAEPHILAAFRQAEKMTADPRTLCTHSDDLGSDDIVVT